ncbi:MAG TPA: OmpA family protein [Edaphocola sp.]|nr:OmpA family protein [Edaphocola sp.]
MKRILAIALIFGLFTGLVACNPQKRLARKRHVYMEKTYLELKDSIKEAQVSILNDTIKVLFPENLLFPVGKAELLPTTKPLLIRFANALIKYDKTSILINGYTDNTGGQALNEQLSANRANNTGNFLKANRIKESRIFTWGRGSRNPIADNNTADGRRKNRRVEFIILYNAGTKK